MKNQRYLKILEYQVLDIFDDTKIEKEILKILEELANNIFVI